MLKQFIVAVALTSAMAANAATVAGETKNSNTPPSTGCLGNALSVCLSYVRDKMRIDEDLLKLQLERANQVDVNGQPLSGGDQDIHLVGPGGEGQSLTITYAPDQRVTKIQVFLKGDPGGANTEEEYSNTGLYAAVVFALGGDCQDLVPLTVYRFFQNEVKPKVTFAPRDSGVDSIHAWDNISREVKGVPFCGKKFSYMHLTSQDTDDIDLENPHGITLVTVVSFE